MLPSSPSSRRTACRAFRPVTPREQTSSVWELGNVPIARGFYKSDQDEELAGRDLPQIQPASSGFNISNIGTPFPPAAAQLRPRFNLLSLKRPPNFCQNSHRNDNVCKIENGSSGYSCLAKKAIFKELARREKGGGH
ncbi:uncharacterized protein N7487_002220 [Penicillium crustosum]|uniref:uncharacterized protein n=1 Tax=Penicillium crustosum TaxID=36656 RepID=UPI0023967AAB|nr:uncharacterized protein N7487_002220 [Penicillium crustosum]KAJ5418670.1 hypothetical protein N7487_002220 [Penicillium crustosum]